MRSKRSLFQVGITALAVFFFSGVSVRAASHNHDLVCLSCGTWDSAGHHTVGDYFVGFSVERPNPTAAYFVFDLTPIKGKTVTSVFLTIPGTNDWNFTAIWAGHTPEHQFKLGMAPQNVAHMDVTDITTGNNKKWVYHFAADPNQNQDLGYNWLVNGLHPGFEFNAFYYNPQRFQTIVNTGGLTTMWACDRYDSGNTGEQYVWGGGVFSKAIVMHVTTSD